MCINLDGDLSVYSKENYLGVFKIRKLTLHYPIIKVNSNVPVPYPEEIHKKTEFSIPTEITICYDQTYLSATFRLFGFGFTYYNQNGY
jgi:hypothetical protein